MKSILIYLVAMLCCVNSLANLNSSDSIPVNPKDVESVDAIIKSLYDVISGPAGEKRNWDRMRTLFIPEGRMFPTRISKDGGTLRRMTVEEYINTIGVNLQKTDFYEKEIGRKTDQFGNIVQVFSAYASMKKPDDEKAFSRGINSIQLWFDGKRWWILTVFWQGESPETPIPEKYIQK